MFASAERRGGWTELEWPWRVPQLPHMTVQLMTPWFLLTTPAFPVCSTCPKTAAAMLVHPAMNSALVTRPSPLRSKWLQIKAVRDLRCASCEAVL